MGVITISIGPTYRKTPSNHAEVREKLGQYQCKACQRIYGEHTDEELDKCMDEMSLALIGNASGRTLRVWEKVDPRRFR